MFSSTRYLSGYAFFCRSNYVGFKLSVIPYLRSYHRKDLVVPQLYFNMSNNVLCVVGEEP